LLPHRGDDRCFTLSTFVWQQVHLCVETLQPDPRHSELQKPVPEATDLRRAVLTFPVPDRDFGDLEIELGRSE
jgi:hypothetical protein